MTTNPTPTPQNDEQPLDLMPTTLIHDDCEAAYELISAIQNKGAIALTGKLEVHTLEWIDAAITEFLGSADEDEAFDDGQDESGDPRWLRHIESTEYIPEIDDEAPAADTPLWDSTAHYVEDMNNAPEDIYASPVDPFIALVRSGNFVILDTETTGLGDDAEICQIAIIDAAGNVLLDTLVKPSKPIPAGATAIHHITDAMVANAPNWLNVNEQVWQLIHDKTVIVYNAEYDFRLIAQSEQACEPLALSDWHTIKGHCAMLRFAEIYGEWNSYYGNYKFQKLETAARYYEVPVNAAHTALGDCLMTLAVCKAMAAQ